MKNGKQVWAFRYYKAAVFILAVFIQSGCLGGGDTNTSPGSGNSDISDVNTNQPAPVHEDVAPTEEPEVIPKKDKGGGEKKSESSTPKEKTSSVISAEDLVKMFPPVPLKESPKLKEVLDLMVGRISYYIPDTIIVMEPFYPSVMVSDSTTLGKKLAEETAKVSSVLGKKVDVKDVKIAEIKIGEKMRAQLREPGNFGNFSIQPDGFTEQRLLPGKKHHTALWQWTVVAKKAGNFSLELILEAVFYTEDEEVTQKIPVFAEKVLVQSIPNYSWVWYSSGGAVLLGLLTFFLIKKGRTSPILKRLDIDKIEALIAKGETSDAIKLLQKQKELSHTNENLLISHLAELNEIRRQYNAGTIERADMQMVVNRINGSLLEICDELKET